MAKKLISLDDAQPAGSRLPAAVRTDLDSTYARFSDLSEVASGVNPNDVGYDIVVLAGQSNTGSGDGYDAMLDWTDPRVQQFANQANATYYRKTIPAQDPLAHYTSMGPGRVSLATTFAKLYAAAIPPNRRVLIVPCGRGSTSFDAPSNDYTWNPSNTTATVNLYNEAVAQVKAALAAHPNSRVAAILWHQGEGDSGSLTAANAYQGRFDALIDGFRAEFGASVPFILGQMNPDRIAEHVAANPTTSGYSIVNSVHIDTPRRKHYTAFAYGPTGMYNGPDEKIHYNAAGQRVLGQRYFEGWRRAKANAPGTAPVAPASVTISAIDGTSVRVNWTQAVSRVTDYKVEYRVDSGAWTTLTRTQSVGYYAEVASLPAGAQVTVRVSTVNEQGTSSATVSNAITLPTGPPALIDSVGISAYTAYSPARKLRGAYSGPALKVRRSTDSTTLDIGFTSAGVLDEAALLAFVGSGSGFVDTLYDQSGNSRHLMQPSASMQPRIVNAGTIEKANGKPALTPVDNLTVMEGEFAGLYAAGAASNVGVWTAPPAGAASGAIFGESASSGGRGRYVPAYWTGGGSPALLITNDADASAASVTGTGVALDGTLRQLANVDTGSAFSAWTDGTARINGTAYTRSNPTTLTRTSFGAVLQGGVTPTVATKSKVCELVTFPVALTDTQRNAAATHQKAFYATP
ncbi:sialate O-acetylesterase [Rhodococcus sp. 5G237]